MCQTKINTFFSIVWNFIFVGVGDVQGKNNYDLCRGNVNEYAKISDA